MIKYDHILINYDQHDQIHVENVQERKFLEIKQINAKKYTGFGVGELGVYGGYWGVQGEGMKRWAWRNYASMITNLTNP